MARGQKPGATIPKCSPNNLRRSYPQVLRSQLGGSIGWFNWVVQWAWAKSFRKNISNFYPFGHGQRKKKLWQLDLSLPMVQSCEPRTMVLAPSAGGPAREDMSDCLLLSTYNGSFSLESPLVLASKCCWWCKWYMRFGQILMDKFKSGSPSFLDELKTKTKEGRFVGSHEKSLQRIHDRKNSSARSR